MNSTFLTIRDKEQCEVREKEKNPAIAPKASEALPNTSPRFTTVRELRVTALRSTTTQTLGTRTADKQGSAKTSNLLRGVKAPSRPHKANTLPGRVHYHGNITHRWWWREPDNGLPALCSAEQKIHLCVIPLLRSIVLAPHAGKLECSKGQLGVGPSAESGTRADGVFQKT